MTLDLPTAKEILKAKKPKDIFGADKSKMYFRLLKVYHPDISSHPQANEITARLNELWSLADGDDYDQVFKPITLQTRRKVYTLTHESKDVSPFYTKYVGVDETDTAVEVRIAQNAVDSDLVRNEAKTLKYLLTEMPDLQVYLPEYVETFSVKGKKGQRQVNVFTSPTADFYSLTAVHHQYPKLHPKDAAWMFRRVLGALGVVHSLNRVYGMGTPSYILIQPEDHGIRLDSWVCSVESEHIPAIDPYFKDFYPPEVSMKNIATCATDIYIVCRTFQWMLNNTNHPMHTFLRGCCQSNPKARPQDAFKLLDEFDEMIENLWGPRSFRPFIMPKKESK